MQLGKDCPKHSEFHPRSFFVGCASAMAKTEMAWSKKEGAKGQGKKEKEMKKRVLFFPKLWFGSVRYDSAAIGSIRYGNGSILFAVVTLLQRPCFHAAC